MKICPHQPSARVTLGGVPQHYSRVSFEAEVFKAILLLELLLASRRAGGSVTTATVTIAPLGRAMA